MARKSKKLINAIASLPDQGICECCGELKEYLEVDHRLPKSWGGTDRSENLHFLCKPCHMTKTRLERYIVMGAVDEYWDDFYELAVPKRLIICDPARIFSVCPIFTDALS